MAARRGVRIEDERGPLDAGRELREQFDPFARHGRFNIDEAGHISTWPRQTRNEAITDRVRDAGKYNRDCPGLPMECSGRWRRSCEDHFELQINQLPREHPHSVKVAGGPTDLYPNITATPPAQFSKPPHETGELSLSPRVVFAIEIGR